MTPQQTQSPSRLRAWIDELPLAPVAMGALMLGAAPFLPEPHLWGKLKMLFYGTLSQPIDIFDLFMHGSGLVLLAVKLIVMALPRP